MFEIVDQKESIDGSIKFVLQSKKNLDLIEAIYFYREVPNSPSEGTICISSQVGCSLNCAFCETGKHGFKRNLTADELQDEVDIIENSIGQNKSLQITSYALMGMGEPLLNLDNICDFYERAIKKDNINLISLATSGICENIIKLAKTNKINFDLFLSLHSPFEEQRKKLMPIAKNYTISQCFDACKYYAQKKAQKVKINYLLLDEVNTSNKHIDELIKIIDKDLFKIQILLYNQGENNLFSRPSDDKAITIRDMLRNAGIETNLIISKGRDVGGGCGQMSGKRIHSNN